MLKVNGLVIPASLEALIRDGKWRLPTDERVLVDVFGELPEDPIFYDIPDILRQNDLWQNVAIHDIFGEVVEGVSIGIIPRRSLVIGSLGIDMPIALDFRESERDPSVAYLLNSGGPAWVQVAINVDDMLSRLYRNGANFRAH